MIGKDGTVGAGWLTDVLCIARCGQLADGTLDDEPLCVSCAGLLVERFNALGIHRRVIEQLPPPWRRDEERGAGR